MNKVEKVAYDNFCQARKEAIGYLNKNGGITRMQVKDILGICSDYGDGAVIIDNESDLVRYMVDIYQEKQVCDKSEDNVNHPSHYCQGEIEVIDYIRDKLGANAFCGYCEGNVLKYVSRWRNKGGVEDLKKAAVYLNWLIERAEEACH